MCCKYLFYPHISYVAQLKLSSAPNLSSLASTNPFPSLQTVGLPARGKTYIAQKGSYIYIDHPVRQQGNDAWELKYSRFSFPIFCGLFVLMGIVWRYLSW